MAANSGAVISWDEVQDKFVEDLVSQFKEEGKTVGAALDLAAVELRRSDSSVRNRYYSVIIKKESVAPADTPSEEEFREEGHEEELHKDEAPHGEEQTPDAPTPTPTNNADTTLTNGESDKKHNAGEVVLQRAGIHVIHDENEDIPPGTSPALIKRAELIDEPYIKVAVSPITRAQLDVMSEPELYDLMMNVMIRLQELGGKREKALVQSRRDLHMLNEEYKEVKVGYTSLLGVINTAREMALKDSEKLMKPSFRMESNGNLETVKQNS